VNRSPLTLNIMTAVLAPGDAIGNYIFTKARIFRDWGARVNLYADFVDPAYAGRASPSSFYRATGEALLWYHYSIYADNVEIARQSADYTVVDFHGISPPHLFAGQDAHLQHLCQKGLDLLPALADDFDLAVVHSEYTRRQLLDNGFAANTVYKLPLCVDTSRFSGAEDEALAARLSQLEYLLFIGRIVPQKDILALLQIFAHVHARRPQTVLILVGSRHLAGAYQRQLDTYIRRKKLGERVLFTGQVNNPAVLAALLNHACLLLVTSEWESFCVPVVEAMYFGTPPVVHQIPPLPEVTGEGGIIIDKAQPEAAANKILHMLAEKDPYDTLSARARRRAASFTDEALRRALLEMLQQAFGDRQ